MAIRGADGRFLPKGSAEEAAAMAKAAGAAEKGTDNAGKAAGKSSGFFAKMAAQAKGLGGSLANNVGNGLKLATPAMGALGGAVQSLASGSIPSATQAMSALGKSFASAATDGASKLATVLKGLGPEGAAVGAALEIVTGAAAALGGSLIAVMGIAIDVTQKIGLMKDRFAALAGSAVGGARVQAMLGKLSATLPFASAQVNAWGQSLLAAGVKGKQLEADVKAIAAAAALMGEQGGAAAETLFKRLGEGGPAADKLLKTFQKGGPKADKLLKDMGLSIKDLGGDAVLAKMNAEQLHKALAKAMTKKGAGPLADMGLQLPLILQKAREGFMSLFAKLGTSVKPFMTAIKGLFQPFTKGGSAIKALQPIVTAVFSTLFSWGTKAVNVLRSVLTWFLNSGKAGGMFSGALSVLKSGWGSIVSIFGAVKSALQPIVGALAMIFSNAMVLSGLKVIFTVIAAVITAVIVVVAALAAAFAAVAGGIAGAVAAIVGAVAGIVGAIVDGLGSLDPSAFVAKMASMAKAGLAAFKSVLGINSPSTVMAQMSGHVVAGTEQGLDAGTGRVADAGAKLGAAASGGAAGGMAGGKARGGSMQVTFAPGSIQIDGAGKSALEITEEMLARVFDRMAATQGLSGATA